MFRVMAGRPGVLVVLCAFLLLCGCRNTQERRADVVGTIDALTESASGAFSAARIGVRGAVDAGTVVVGTVQDTTENLADRADKIHRGTELIREGLTGNKAEEE